MREETAGGPAPDEPEPPRATPLRDLGSTNGTYVRGRAVTATRLRDGDAVTFGLLTVRLTWSRWTS
jgi:hypothetical protein